MTSKFNLQAYSLLCLTCDFGATLRSIPAVLVIASVLHCGTASALEVGSGLENEDYKSIEVLIEELDDDDKKAGLSENLIRAKVNLRLRQNGLSPVDVEPARKESGYLYVHISTVQNAYSIYIHFNRVVLYTTNNQAYRVLGDTWKAGSTGVFAKNVDYILDDLEDQLDIFIDAYLTANAP